MPARHLIRHIHILLVLVICATFCGCGGGGGGSAAQSGTVVDPASFYAGTATQAVVTSANAEALAKGAFAGGSLGKGLVAAGGANKSATRPGAEAVPMRQLVQTLKLSTRRLALPQQAAQMRMAAGASGAKVMRQNTFQVTGDNGGTASYTLEINDATGSFYGTVSYSGYTSHGTTMDGTCDLLGSFDSTVQEVTRLTLSFTFLSISTADAAFTLRGTVSWTYQYASKYDTVTMNLVLKNNGTGKTYWFKDYSITNVYGESDTTVLVTGRYFDHDHGYVDIETTTPLTGSYTSAAPVWGVLVMKGAGGNWVSIRFDRTLFVIEADTNGDGAVDWQTIGANTSSGLDAIPVAEAGADQAVTEGTTVQLDGSASSDGDGDPLSYSWRFERAPGTITPALTGSNTATPSFTPLAPGTYELTLTVYDGSASSTDLVTVTVAPAPPLQPAAVKQGWQFGIYGANIGGAGLIATDLDGDGVQEIIASARTEGFNSQTFWYVVRKSASGYEQVWRSDNYGIPIMRILLADLNADGKKEVIVALSDGTIHCYDGPTLQELSGLKVAPSLQDIAIADVDGDGLQEVVTTDGSAVRVYSAQTGVLKWEKSACGGNSLAVGNVDAIAGNEIVTTGYGGRGYVIDGATGTVKWEYANGFGARVRLADLDGDGKQEIVGASAWYKITIFDAALKSPMWEIATQLDIAAVEVIDTDGDGVPEIVYGDNQWGKLHAIDAQTHGERWAINNPSSGVSGIAFGDVDLDGKKEIVWGAGGNTSGADFLYIGAPSTGAIKWQNRDLYGLSTLAVGGLANDGTDQLLMVTASSDSGYENGIIHVFDPRSHALLYQEGLGLMDWMGDKRAVKIGDVDGDGRSEFIVSTSNTYDGFIRVYDGAARTVKASTATYDGNYFSAIALGDVDGDGKVEIVAGQGREHSGAQGVYVIVFDGITLKEKWRSVDLGPYWGSVYDLKLADLNGDGRQDIICSVAGSGVVVFDGVTHVQKAIIRTSARAVAVADVDGDGFPEILVGSSDGKIEIYDGVNFTVKKTVSTFSTSAVDALLVADLDGNGSQKWLLASGGVLSILQGERLYWRSAPLGYELGKGNNIAVRDTDNDGHPNIFVGSNATLYQFKYLGASAP